MQLQTALSPPRLVGPCSARGAAAAARPLFQLQGHSWDLTRLEAPRRESLATCVSVCTLGSTLASPCRSHGRCSERVCCAARSGVTGRPSHQQSSFPPAAHRLRSDFVDKLQSQFVTVIYQRLRGPELPHQMLLPKCFCFRAGRRADVKVGRELCSWMLVGHFEDILPRATVSFQGSTCSM